MVTYEAMACHPEPWYWDGARYWDRTSDPLRVREVLYR